MCKLNYGEINDENDGDNFMRSDVALLIGAGFSFPAGIPTMKGLARDFAENLAGQERAVYSKLSAFIPEISEDFEILLECCGDLKSLPVNLLQRFLENKFFRAYKVLNGESNNCGICSNNKRVGSDHFSCSGSLHTNPWHGVLISELVEDMLEIVEGARLLEQQLKEYLRVKCLICKDSIGYLNPLMLWLKKSGVGLDIFSLNYDLLIETLAEEFFIPYTDGFMVNWDSSLFDDDKYQIRLFKLHGSFIWYQSEVGERIKIPIFYHKNEVEYLAQDKVVSMMVYPRREKQEPFEELVRRFRERLLTLQKLVVIGYSFRDVELKAIVEEGLRKNTDLHLVLVSPGAVELAKSLQWGKRVQSFAGGIEDWVTTEEFIRCFQNVNRT